MALGRIWVLDTSSMVDRFFESPDAASAGNDALDKAPRRHAIPHRDGTDLWAPFALFAGCLHCLINC